MIKTLDPKLNPASAEIMLLRKQIMEKDKKIEALEVKIYIYVIITSVYSTVSDIRCSNYCFLMIQSPSMLHSIIETAQTVKPRDFYFGLINLAA